MASESQFGFALKLLKKDGQPLRRHGTGEPLAPIPVQADFAPAVAWARFDAFRRGAIPREASCRTVVEPSWDSTLGDPYIRGFRVRLYQDDKRDEVSFPVDYFLSKAQELSTAFVRSGDLQAGESFLYVAMAYRVPAQGPRNPSGDAPVRRIAVRRRTLSRPPPLASSALSAWEARAVPTDKQVEGDLPLFVPQPVLDVVAQRTRAAGALETGGFLLGFLHRCTDSGSLFLEVTAQIDAQFAHGELTRLTFPAETFRAARATAVDRGAGELLVGWWHCHNYLMESCRSCAGEKKKACGVRADFFSEDDAVLHRTCFLDQSSVALVSSNSPCAGLTWGLFGWRRGVIARRGFGIVDRPVRKGEEA